MSAVTSVQDLVLATLRSPHPEWELRGAVRAMLATGYEREKLIHELNSLRRDLAAQGREREEDALFDVLDALAGWSVPSLGE